MNKIIYTAPLLLTFIACTAPTNPNEARTITKNSTKQAIEKVNYVAPKTLPAKFEGAAAGSYSLEKTHAFLMLSLSHGGLSNYIMKFNDFDVKLNFDPNNAAANSVSATINPASISTDYPGDYKAGHADSGFDSWDQHLGFGEKYLNANQFPTITFQSTSLTRTDDYTGKLTGDLTFLGVTKPITMKVEYNGVGNKPWFGERDIIGFNAKTTINRSDFGMTYLVPNIGDEVTIKFTGEFLQDPE